MLRTIDDIRERLIAEYDPDRIILFGSAAQGTSRRGSDIDLMIVKETDKRPLDRRIEVETLLSDRMIPVDVLVYTPDEVRQLYSLGSPFVEEVVETGRVLYMRKATAAWIRDAQDEFESASVLYEHEMYRSACYHSQQAVEKGLKAYIIEKGQKPERTHDIVELFNTVAQLGFDSRLSTEDAIYLNSIYKGRYPTEDGLLPHGEPSKTDTERAVQAAKRLIERLTLMVSDVPTYTEGAAG